MYLNVDLELTNQSIVAIQKCINLLRDELDPNPEKKWLNNQSMVSLHINR